jgi:hypothetical protein
MKDKIAAVLLVSLLLTSVAMVAFHAPEVSAVNDNVRLYVDPASISKVPSDLNSFFDVYVTIADVTDLFGFDINITWDNSLITFNSYDSTPLNTVWPNGWQDILHPSGAGTFKFVALSTNSSFTLDPGSHALFGVRFKIVKACNFEWGTDIHFEAVKLSDSHWTAIPSTQTDGDYHMDKTIPGLKLELVDPNPSKPFEYCKTFQVKVNVTHICAQLEDYDLTILYDTELLKLTGVDWTGGVLGDTSDNAGYTESPQGTVQVVDTGGIIWSGDSGLLFTLTFHIEFDARVEHIWRTKAAQNMTAHISFSDAALSFVEGTIPMSGITMPSALDILVNFIRGDVTCDGIVDCVGDLRTVAYYYDKTNIQPTDPWYKYDLTMDGTIDIFDLVVVATNVWYGY